ncbi:hypothetical protein WP66_004563 [Salmonella enterica subsp. enterica]|nr:hypothetical protein [Salmonella enterica subsp. enterica]
MAKNCLNDNEPVPDVPADTVTAQKTTPEKPTRNASRKPLPADLPRETRTLLPEDSVCPPCGGELKVMGETISEQLEIINTAFKVIETVRPKLACSRCDVILQAPLPDKPVEGSRVGSSLLARILVGKYVGWHNKAVQEIVRIPFSPGLTALNLRGKKQDWLAAIDRLIESRGACCWLPLSVSDGWRLFPETKFQTSERRRRQGELSAEKYTRQRRKEACQRETAYRALAGQAEIELAFHTPETVSSWSARWSGTELRQYDLEDMFWRWMMANQPFWSVMVESDALAKESPESVRQLERWMVPNKLIHRSHA